MISSSATTAAWWGLGWTMLQFLWLGGLLVVFCVLLRWILRPFAPQIRSAATLSCFVSFVLTPFALFCQLWRFYGQHPPPAEQIVIPPLAPAVVMGLEAGKNEWLVTSAAYLPWLWMLGAPLVTLWVLLGYRRVHQTLNTTQPAPLPLRRRLQEICDRIGMKRRIDIRLSPRIPSPILTGIVRPCILLPVAISQGLSLDQAEMVFLHELAHARRFDNARIAIQRLCECFLFFHPGIWIFSRWLTQDREECCDRWVLQQTGAAVDYAETLCQLAERATLAARMSCPMAGGSLRCRIQRILRSEDVSMSRTGKFFTVLTFAATSIAVATAAPFAAQAVSGFSSPAAGDEAVTCPASPGDACAAALPTGLLLGSQVDPTASPHPTATTGPHPMLAHRTVSCQDCHATSANLLPTARVNDCTACHRTDAMFPEKARQWRGLPGQLPRGSAGRLSGGKTLLPRAQRSPGAKSEACDGIVPVRDPAGDIQEIQAQLLPLLNRLERIDLQQCSPTSREELERSLRKTLKLLRARATRQVDNTAPHEREAIPYPGGRYAGRPRTMK